MGPVSRIWAQDWCTLAKGSVWTWRPRHQTLPSLASLVHRMWWRLEGIFIRCLMLGHPAVVTGISVTKFHLPNSFPATAVINDHKGDSVKQPEGQKSKITISGQNSGCRQGHAPSQVSRGESFLPPSAFSGPRYPWLVSASPESLPLQSYHCLFIFSSYKDPSHVGLVPTLVTSF